MIKIFEILYMYVQNNAKFFKYTKERGIADSALVYRPRDPGFDFSRNQNIYAHVFSRKIPRFVPALKL